MKRIYLAGPYSADVWQGLKNIGIGVRAGLSLLLGGYAPFVPWLDHLFFFFPEARGLTAEIMKAFSMVWLEVCDAVLVLPGWEHSDGTKKEIIRAKELNIPVFYTREDLDAWVRKETGE